MDNLPASRRLFSLFATLVLILLLVAQTVLAKEKGKDTSGKFNYPDVWGVELPNDGTGRAMDALIFNDTNDHILISYWFETTEDRIYRIYDFFEQKTINEWRVPLRGMEQEKAAAVALMEEERRWYEKAKGVTMLAVEWETPYSYHRSELLEYNDGSLLKRGGGTKITIASGGETSFQPCNYGLNSLRRWWKGRTSNEIPTLELNQGVTFLRLYPDAQPLDPVEICECIGKNAEYLRQEFQGEITRDIMDSSALLGCNEKDVASWSLTYRVRALQIIGDAAVLRDGTFLLKDHGYPTVIRFRPYLESPYLSTRADLFLLPDREVSALVDQAVKQYRQKNDKQNIPWAFDGYDLAAIFKILDPIAVNYLQQKRRNSNGRK